MKNPKKKKNQRFKVPSMASLGETNFPMQKSANSILESKNSEIDIQKQLMHQIIDSKSKSEPFIYDYYDF